MLDAIILSVTAPKIFIVEIPKNHFSFNVSVENGKKSFLLKKRRHDFSITALSKMAFIKATFSITTLSLMTFGKMHLIVILGIKVT
jgi:hypothetical protein